MSRLNRWLLVTAPALLMGAPLFDAQAGERGTRYAFLIGCSQYLKTEFRVLPYTGNDVDGFRAALLSTGFEPESIVVMKDDKPADRRYLPEKAKIMHELDLLLDGIRPDDTLVVALSGHGLQFKGERVSYFAPVDGKVADKSTLIPLTGKDGLYERIQGVQGQ
jgi:uncharacterized caspase-like protein